MLEKMSWTLLPWRRKWEDQKAVPHLCFTEVVSSALFVLEGIAGWFCDSTAALSCQKQNQPEPGAALQHWKLDLVPRPLGLRFPWWLCWSGWELKCSKKGHCDPTAPLHAVPRLQPGLLDGRMVQLISDCAISDDDLWKNTLQPFLLLVCPAVLAQTLYNGVTEWQW